MRMTKPLLITIAAFSLLTAPCFAGNAKAPKADAEESSPTCSSYQVDAEGNWVPKPCHELGTHSSSEHRAPSKNHEPQGH